MSAVQDVLLIEDEFGLVEFLRIELELQGFTVAVATTGTEGLERFRESAWDIVLLDWMLPDVDGIEVCKALRARSDVPIIFLTARGAVVDRVSGLEAGADDYLVKPFAIEELLARMRALIRRGERKMQVEEIPGSQYQFGDVSVDVTHRRVRKDGALVELTVREFDLLMVLWEHRGEVLSRQQLLHQVWGFETPVDTNVVDVYIGYLRHKLDEDKKYIRTVRGLGYSLRGDQS
jgi:DNA-binding response OmpR family regulator